MNKASILLDTKIRDLMKSVARKEQTYSDFILELIEHKTACARNHAKEMDYKTVEKKESIINSPRGSASKHQDSSPSVEGQ